MKENNGSVFRLLRHEKGIKLKEAAKGVMSETSLSIFETKNSQITLQHFMDILNNIHVSYYEFLSRVKSDSNWELIISNIDLANSRRDIIELQRINIKLEKFYKDSNQTIYKYLMIATKALLSKQGYSVSISNDEKESIISYFMNVEEWGIFEFWLFKKIIELLSVSQVVFLIGNEFEKLKKLKNSSLFQSKPMYYCLLTIINYFLEKKELKLADHFLNIINSIKKENEVEVNLKIQFMFDKLMFLQEGKTEESIFKAMNFLHDVGEESMANNMFKNFKNLNGKV